VVEPTFYVQGGEANVVPHVPVYEVIQGLEGVCGAVTFPTAEHTWAEVSEVCQLGYYHSFQYFRKNGLELDGPLTFCLFAELFFYLREEDCSACLPAVGNPLAVGGIHQSQEEFFPHFPAFANGSPGDVVEARYSSIR